MIQPSFFDEKFGAKVVENDVLMMFALGEFQKRGKELAERELPLDRLLGAIRRSAEHFQTAELNDEEIAETLVKLGAKVVRRPNFFAKHPFRITVPVNLAEKSLEIFQNEEARQAAENKKEK